LLLSFHFYFLPTVEFSIAVDILFSIGCMWLFIFVFDIMLVCYWNDIGSCFWYTTATKLLVMWYKMQRLG